MLRPTFYTQHFLSNLCIHNGETLGRVEGIWNPPNMFDWNLWIFFLGIHLAIY